MKFFSKELNRSNSWAVFLFFLLFTNLVALHPDYHLQGIVLNSENNKPLANVNILVINHNIFAVTKDDGSFDLEFEELGQYQLKITHVAFREELITFNLADYNHKKIIVYMIPKMIDISPVIVMGQNTLTKFDELYESSNVLRGKELQRELGLSLAATLKNETGLAIRSMGPAPARPVIRGLGGDRVMITEDGVKVTDLSATSPDHAVTIEPFSLDKIEVIRGPRVLIKTPITIGGVVNVVRNETPVEIHNQVYGIAGIYGESANNGYLGSLISEIPLKPFVVRLEGSRRKVNDLMTPVGKLPNSYAENYNWSIGSSYFPSFGKVGVSYRDFNLSYGIPGGFIGAHPNGVDIDMYRRQFNVISKINLPSNTFDNIEVHLSHVVYRHKEFEDTGLIGSEFKVKSYLGYINTNYRGFGFLSNGTFGVSSQYRDFEIGGFVFTPRSNSLNLSTYVYESFNYNNFSFEFGARYNYDKITPEEEKPNAKIGHVREREFHTYSLSFSALYTLTNIVHFGININKSSRVPTIEELYSEGPHLAAYSYETGNPNLEDERGWGAEFFVYHNFSDLFFHLNIFRNDLSYYIVPRNTGELNYATFLPIYQTEGVGALFYGVEGQIQWEFLNNFRIGFTISHTKGNFKNSDQPLPQIPPLKGNFEFIYFSDHLTIGINSEVAAAQKRVDEFEEPTAGYGVLNSFIQYSISNENLLHLFSLSVDNIFDKEYRNHLSRVKSILPEAGRNFRLTYKLYFHI